MSGSSSGVSSGPNDAIAYINELVEKHGDQEGVEASRNALLKEDPSQDPILTEANARFAKAENTLNDLRTIRKHAKTFSAAIGQTAERNPSLAVKLGTLFDGMIPGVVQMATLESNIQTAQIEREDAKRLVNDLVASRNVASFGSALADSLATWIENTQNKSEGFVVYDAAALFEKFEQLGNALSHLVPSNDLMSLKTQFGKILRQTLAERIEVAALPPTNEIPCLFYALENLRDYSAYKKGGNVRGILDSKYSFLCHLEGMLVEAIEAGRERQWDSLSPQKQAVQLKTLVDEAFKMVPSENDMKGYPPGLDVMAKIAQRLSYSTDLPPSIEFPTDIEKLTGWREAFVKMMKAIGERMHSVLQEFLAQVAKGTFEGNAQATFSGILAAQAEIEIILDQFLNDRLSMRKGYGSEDHFPKTLRRFVWALKQNLMLTADDLSLLPASLINEEHGFDKVVERVFYELQWKLQQRDQNFALKFRDAEAAGAFYQQVPNKETHQMWRMGRQEVATYSVQRPQQGSEQLTFQRRKGYQYYAEHWNKPYRKYLGQKN